MTKLNKSIASHKQGVDYDTYVIRWGSQQWVLTAHAHGWSHLVSPSGRIHDGDSIDTRDGSPEAEVISWLYDNV